MIINIGIKFSIPVIFIGELNDKNKILIFVNKNFKKVKGNFKNKKFFLLKVRRFK